MGPGAVPQRYLIAIGGNLPIGMAQPLDVVRRGIALVTGRIGGIRGISPLYATPAFPPGAGPDFVNAALALDSALPPAALLATLHAIEAEMQRERRARWGTRTLDLDLIGAGDAVLPDRATFRRWLDLPEARRGVEAPATLILPHPRMQERAFVLVPLRDVAPDWRHPVLGRTVAQMCAELPPNDRDSVRFLAPPPCQDPSA